MLGHHPLRAAAAVVCLLAVGCSGDDGAGGEREAPPDLTTPTTASTTTDPADVPLTGEPLMVAEQGFSTFPDPIDPDATLGGYGVVIANPNATVMATGVAVRVRIVDAAETVLFDDTSLLNAVAPAGRMAVGGTLLEPIVDPVRLDVEIQVAAWLLPAHPEGGFVAEGVVTEPEPGGGAITRFTIRSTWPVDEDGLDVTALYRAADGRILAGEQGSVEAVPAGGTVAAELRLLTPIPDLATTEVLVGRGFSAQTVG